MDLLNQIKIPNTELYWLERVREIHHDDYDITQNKKHIPEDYNYSAETYGSVTACVTPTAKLSEYLLDLMHPVKEGEGHYIPNNSKLWDAWTRTREKAIEDPSQFHAHYKEHSTINRKRSPETKAKEAQRVNKAIDDNIDELNYQMREVAVGLLTHAIDEEVKRHNEAVKDTVKRWVMDNGVGEEWIVKNLYSDSQKIKHKAQTEAMEELNKQIDELRGKYRELKKLKNDQRRFAMQLALIEWTKDIADLQVYVQELPLDEAIDQDISMVLM
jgi:hypothetical protein